MKLIVTKDYEELSAKAARIMLEVVKDNPYAVLGLATGTTPLGLYAHMIVDHEKHGTSYAHIRTVNLDEYKGLPKTHPQSYAYFMRKSAPATTRSSNSSRVTFSCWGWAATGISRSTSRARPSGAARTSSRLRRAR